MGWYGRPISLRLRVLFYYFRLDQYRTWSSGRRDRDRMVGGGDPPVASALYSFDKDRIVGGIPQRVAQAVDRTADPVVEVDEHPLRPKRETELLAAEHLVGAAQQKLQGAKREVLNLDLGSAFSEFARAHVS